MTVTDVTPLPPADPVPTLILAAKQFFVARKITAEVQFGRKKDAQQGNQGEGGANRVVFYEGDEAGNLGEIVGPKPKNDGGPRVLFTWNQLFTVSIWAADESDTNDELKQFVALSLLWENTMQAVHAFARADAVWGNPKRITQAIELPFGAALKVPLKYRRAMNDVVVSKAMGVTPALTPSLENP